MRHLFFLLFAFAFLLFSSCDKEKLDYTYNYAAETYKPSAVRIVNLGQYASIAVKGDTLSTGSDGETAAEGYGYYWWLPTHYFENDEGLYVSFPLTVSFSGSFGFTIPADSANRLDYYTLLSIGSGQPYAVPVERDETPPSRPDHFKIRILNLAKNIPALPAAYPSYTGALENLVGPVTLTYADGTAVSQQTNNVTVAQRVSEYVEVPYGTYQFRVLASGGRQIAGKMGSAIPAIDPPSSRVPIGETAVNGMTQAQIKTFQPGGVYTLVVAPAVISYYSPAAGNNNGGRAYHYQNVFYIIEDKQPPANMAYGKVQVVNALPDASVSFMINGASLGSGLAFGESSDYTIVPSGSYRVTAQSRVGSIDVELEHPLLPGQNHTVWLWRDEAGDPRLVPVHNDLGGIINRPAFSEDASINRLITGMATGIRFANFSPDIPYLSFTINNGLDYRENYRALLLQPAYDPTLPIIPERLFYQEHGDNAMYNLESGQPATELPMTWWNSTSAYYWEFLAYRSSPDVTPGNWAADIPVLYSYNLVAQPELYWQASRGMPGVEAGFYTIALVGRTGDEVPEAQKARMVIVKHSR